MKVFIWNAGQGGVGHVSVKLTDGTHISWWPSDENRKYLPTGHVKRAPAFPNQTLEDDIEFEERIPDHTYHVKHLDEDKIGEWWNTFRRRNTRWELFSMNCSTVAFEALKAGGALERFSFFSKLKWKCPGVWKPWTFKEFLTGGELSIQEIFYDEPEGFDESEASGEQDGAGKKKGKSKKGTKKTKTKKK